MGNCKPHPESKFPNEYIGVIFIQIDQHLKKLFKKFKGFPIFWNMVYVTTKVQHLDTKY